MKRMAMALMLGLSSSALWAGDTLRQWSETILQQQPERILNDAYRTQADQVKQAGDSMLGNMAIRLKHENGDWFGTQGFSSWEAGLALPLKSFSQRKTYGALADAYGQVARAQQGYLAWRSRGVARQLLNKVVEKAIYASHDVNRLAQAQKLFDLVKSQVDAGARSRLDLVLARQRLSQARARKVASEAALAAALVELKAWGIELAPQRLPELVAEAPSLTDFNDMGAVLARHPRLQLLDAQRQLALAQAHKSVWDARNSVEIYAGARHEAATGTPDDTIVSLEVSVPLGRAPDAQLARGEVRLTERQWRAQIDTARRDIRQALLAARAALETARAQVQPAAAQLAAAEAALKLSEQAWKQGEIPLRDLLLAQQARLDAALNVALVRFAVQKAIRNLNQQAGE